MATSITWYDTAARTLTNSKPVPADRFANWTPITPPEASAVYGLGTGARHQWLFRQDYGAAFELPMIPVTDTDLVMRFLRHIQQGGEFTVKTGDAQSREYDCIAFPGWDIPEGPEFADNRMLEYTLALKVKHTLALDMLCNYGSEAMS